MDQLTATALAVALVFNLVVLALAFAWARRTRKRGPTSSDAARSARAPQPGAAERGPWWAGPEGTDAAGRPVRGLATPSVEPAVEHPRRVEVLESLETRASWRPILTLEAARVSRYGRPATVVIADLEGLDRLAARLGPEAADRLLPAVAGTIRREARSADRIARLANSRFGILLPETDEVAAINWVERVREAVDLWLDASAVSLRLAFGWAELGPDADVDAVLALANERLDGERRGQHSNPRPEIPTSRPRSPARSRPRVAAGDGLDAIGDDSRPGSSRPTRAASGSPLAAS